MLRAIIFTAALYSALSAHAVAQEDVDPPENIAFDGGTFTITQNEDYEKVLTYDGREIARDYVVFHDRIVDVGEVKVALFAVGGGGNQCGPAMVIAWNKNGAIQSQTVGEECGAPPAAVTDSGIYFVPHVLPGETLPVRFWSPDDGLKIAGDLTFTPQPNTRWETFEAAELRDMIDAFENRDVHDAAKALLGSELTGVVTGLLTGGVAEQQADGTVTGYGCVPHACGVSDTFMAVDPKARKLYFAQQGDGAEPRTWPALAKWPAKLRAAMNSAIGRGNP